MFRAGLLLIIRGHFSVYLVLIAEICKICRALAGDCEAQVFKLRIDNITYIRNIKYQSKLLKMKPDVCI